MSGVIGTGIQRKTSVIKNEAAKKIKTDFQTNLHNFFKKGFFDEATIQNYVNLQPR